MPAQTPCRYYLRKTCFRGDSCKFLHEQAAPAPVPVSVSIPEPTSPARALLRAEAPVFTPPCRFFAKGYCSRGRSCRFKHLNDASIEGPAEISETSTPQAPIPDTVTLTLATHTIKFGPGLEIASVKPTIPVSDTISIEGLPIDATDYAILEMLVPYGIDSVTTAFGNAYILATLTEAASAAAALNGRVYDRHVMHVSLVPTPTEPAIDASRLTIIFPGPTLTANALFPLRKPTAIAGYHITYSPSRNGKTTLTGLSLSTRRVDLCRALGTKDVTMESPAAYTAPQVIEYVRGALEELGSRVISIDLVSGLKAKNIRLNVRLANSRQARLAVDGLHHTCHGELSNGRITVRQIFTTKLRSARGVVDAVTGELDTLRKSEVAKHTRLAVYHGAEGAPTNVIVSGPDRPSVVSTKAAVRALLHGEVVAVESGGPLWENDMMTRKGIDRIRKVDRETGVYIHYDVHRRQLTVHGPPYARRAAITKLLELWPPVAPTETLPVGRPEEGDCPVCLTPAEPGLDPLPCGHRYCPDCFNEYLSQATAFPINCITCNIPLPLHLLPTSLRSAAWSSHVRRHPDTLRFCPTPDCTGVLDIAGGSWDSPGVPQTCAECLVEICARCCVEMHDYDTCAGHMAALDLVGQQAFEEWMKGRDVKKCGKAGCGAIIEKMDGCNHVTCGQCGGHMCWVCSGVWEEAQLVYDHMMGVHGSFGNFGEDELELVGW